MAGLLDWITEKAKAQYAKGAPYREAATGLLQGDMNKVNQALSKSELTPMDFATTFAPMGVTAWHGSPYPFEKFDLNAPKTTGGGMNTHGVFTSLEKPVAERYAKDFGKNGYLYKVDADVTNPLNLTANEYEKLQSIVGKIDKNQKLNEFEQISLENMLGKHGYSTDMHPIQAIKNAGFDSIAKDKGRFGTAESELMIFDPNKVKILERNGLLLP